MNFPGTKGQIYAFEDRLVPDSGMEITDLKKDGGVGSDHGKQKQKK